MHLRQSLKSVSLHALPPVTVHYGEDSLMQSVVTGCRTQYVQWQDPAGFRRARQRLRPRPVTWCTNSQVLPPLVRQLSSP